jgi:hypothetical protein
MMFGRFTYPCRHAGKEFAISIEREGEFFRYRRECDTDCVEKIIASDGPALYVHPVEPVNLPKEVTRFLEIVFPSIVIEPESKKTIYLTFPIEIGVFIAKNEDYQLIDVFSRCQPKYSLYGIPDNGVITRYHESPVSDTPGNPDPAYEGVLKLDIHNISRGWSEVPRVVFDSYHMPIFFGDVVAMSGELVIFSKTMAETQLSTQPLREGMEMAIPAIRARRIILMDVERKSFLMEQGVG